MCVYCYLNSLDLVYFVSAHVSWKGLLRLRILAFGFLVDTLLITKNKNIIIIINEYMTQSYEHNNKKHIKEKIKRYNLTRNIF